MGIRGIGSTLEEAFENAAIALTAVICGPDSVRPDQSIPVHCEGEGDMLFVEWIEAIIYEMATRRMLFSRFDLAIHDGALDATLHGEAIDIDRHQPAVEVKGATLTALLVERGADGAWQAQCIVDV